MTARTWPPSAAQKMRPNPAESLAFCAPGWRVTWRKRDPRIRALSPPIPPTWRSRLARDMVAPWPTISPLPLAAERGSGAAAPARPRDSPAPAGHVAAVPVDDADVVGIPDYRSSASSPPNEQPRISLGTRYTVWNSLAASITVCRTTTRPSSGARLPRPGWVNLGEQTPGQFR